MTQHAELTAERWARFDLGQQILQIGLELHRARPCLRDGELTRARQCHERALRLLDLTVEVQTRRALRRELLRWRDVVAEMYVSERPDPRTNELALRVLYELHPTSVGQLQYLGLGVDVRPDPGTPDAR